MTSMNDFAEIIMSRFSALGLHINDDPEDFSDVENALAGVTFIRNEHVPTAVIAEVANPDGQTISIEAFLEVEGMTNCAALPFDTIDAEYVEEGDVKKLIEEVRKWASERNYRFESRVDPEEYGIPSETR